MQGYARFWIKYFMIDVWQYYEYALYSEYVKVLNMLGLRSIIHVWQNFEYSSGSQYAWVWIYKGCEYGKVTQGSVLTVF